MFKTGGFLTDEMKAQAADAFQSATESLILQKAKENLAKEKNVQQTGENITFIKSKEQKTNKEKDPIDIDDLEDDEEYEKLKRQRIEQLKNQQKKLKENLEKGHGKYEEIEEVDFLKNVLGSQYVVCHFYHRDFERCKIVDKHLNILAPKHLSIRFIKINAEKAPFFVTKLAIRVLPTIICFKDGVAVDRIVGFQEIGTGRDDFKTIELERRLKKSGIFV